MKEGDNMQNFGKLTLVTLLLFALLAGGLLLGVYAEEADEPLMPDEYSQTERIYAGLSIVSGNATCTGRLDPSGTQSCTLEMKLFVKNGSSWIKVQAWSASATGGNSAGLVETISVNHGTYKVVCYGNVAGEQSNITSNIVTW